MKILIVEDDQNKLQHLAGFIRHYNPSATIISKKSYHSGLKEAMIAIFDIIILDMSMPTYDIQFGESGGRPRPFGGRDLLMQIRRKGVGTPIIFVTQFETFGDGEDRTSFDQLRKQLHTLEGEKFTDLIYYNSAQDAWKQDLKIALDKITKPGKEA